MSEMLGNQYFLGRNYLKAQVEFEHELNKHSENYAIQKKLIICYTQTSEFQKAISQYVKLIQANIDLLVDTDPVRDDCPCPELVTHMKSSINEYSSSFEERIISGILWSYCDLQNAYEIFLQAEEAHPNNSILRIILSVIKEYLDKKNILIQLN